MSTIQIDLTRYVESTNLIERLLRDPPFKDEAEPIFRVDDINLDAFAALQPAFDDERDSDQCFRQIVSP